MAQEGQYPGSIWMPCSQFWKGRGNHAIRYIIIHGTATPGIATAQGIGRLFQSRAGKTSGPNDGATHYVVGKDGTIVQCVREGDSAWGNGVVTEGHDDWWGTRGNPNFETISIEHVKVGAQNQDALTAAQMEASFALIAYLCDQWNIPRRWADAMGGITGHFSIDPVNRAFCPGLYPWDDLFARLNNAGTPPGTPAVGTRGDVQTQATSSGDTSTSAPASAALSVTGVNGAGQKAHDALIELPGFAGIAVAVDQAESFVPLSGGGVGDILGWVGANMFALVVRALIILAGLVLCFGLLVALARKNDWMGDAGGDVIPLAMQGLHPTTPQ